jgi:hypothetical protein
MFEPRKRMHAPDRNLVMQVANEINKRQLNETPVAFASIPSLLCTHAAVAASAAESAVAAESNGLATRHPLDECRRSLNIHNRISVV